MRVRHQWLPVLLVGMIGTNLCGCSSAGSSQPELVGKWQHKVAKPNQALPNQKTTELISFLFNVAPQSVEKACQTMFELDENPYIRLAFKDGSSLVMALETSKPGQKIAIGDDDFSASGSWTLNNTDGNRLRINVKQPSSGKAREFWFHFQGKDQFGLTAVGGSLSDALLFNRISAK